MQTTETITTQREVRRLFWEFHPEFSDAHRVNKRQNEYPADIRAEFVIFVDMLHREGSISSCMANKVTL